MVVRSGNFLSMIEGVPPGWEVRSVGDVFKICDDLRLPLSATVRQRMPGPYPYYGPTGPLDSLNKYHLDGEYATIGQDGSHFLKWQDAPQTQLLHGKYTVNNHVHLLQGSAQYLTAWFAAAFRHRDLTRSLTRQGVDRFQLTRSALARILCAFPPVAEQRAILGVLKDADSLVAGLEALAAKASFLKQVLTRELLTGVRRLAGFHGDWAAKLLGTLGICSTGDTPSTDRPECWGGDLAWLPSGQVNGQVLRMPGFTDTTISRVGLQLSSTRRIRAPAVLIAVSGVTCGQVALLEFDAAINQCVVAVEPAAGVDPQYLYYALTSMRAAVVARRNGSPRGRTSLRSVKGIPILLPPFEEQKAVAAVLAEMDAEILDIEDRKRKADTVNRALLLDLVMGKRRLQPE
jgi:type I restriction enzyme, S subunit